MMSLDHEIVVAGEILLYTQDKNNCGNDEEEKENIFTIQKVDQIMKRHNDTIKFKHSYGIA